MATSGVSGVSTQDLFKLCGFRDRDGNGVIVKKSALNLQIRDENYNEDADIDGDGRIVAAEAKYYLRNLQGVSKKDKSKYPITKEDKATLAKLFDRKLDAISTMSERTWYGAVEYGKSYEIGETLQATLTAIEDVQLDRNVVKELCMKALRIAHSLKNSFGENDSVQKIISTLTKSGLIKEALTIVRTLEEGPEANFHYSRFNTLILMPHYIAVSKLSINEKEALFKEFLSAAKTEGYADDLGNSIDLLINVAEGMHEAGFSRNKVLKAYNEAIACAKPFKDREAMDSWKNTIARSMVKSGFRSEPLELGKTIRDLNQHNYIIMDEIDEFIKNRDFDRALELVPSLRGSAKEDAYHSIANGLLEAKQLLRAFDVVQKSNMDEGWYLFVQIAEALAKAGITQVHPEIQETIRAFYDRRLNKALNMIKNNQSNEYFDRIVEIRNATYYIASIGLTPAILAPLLKKSLAIVASISADAGHKNTAEKTMALYNTLYKISISGLSRSDAIELYKDAMKIASTLVGYYSDDRESANTALMSILISMKQSGFSNDEMIQMCSSDVGLSLTLLADSRSFYLWDWDDKEAINMLQKAGTFDKIIDNTIRLVRASSNVYRKVINLTRIFTYQANNSYSTKVDRKYLDEALSVARSAEDPAVKAKSLSHIASKIYNMGAIHDSQILRNEANGLFDEAMAAVKKTTNPADRDNALGAVSSDMADVYLYKESSAALDWIGDPKIKTYACGDILFLVLERHDYKEAMAILGSFKPMNMTIAAKFKARIPGYIIRHARNLDDRTAYENKITPSYIAELTTEAKNIAASLDGYYFMEGGKKFSCIKEANKGIAKNIK